MGYSLDLGTQVSTSGDAQSGGGSAFTFGGIDNGGSNNQIIMIAGFTLLAVLLLKKSD